MSDDELTERLGNLTEAAKAAEVSAQELMQRLEALDDRAAVVQQSALAALLEKLNGLHESLNNLDEAAERASSAASDLAGATDDAKSQAQEATQAAEVQLTQMGETINSHVGILSQFLDDSLRSRVEDAAQNSAEKLEESVSAAQSAWVSAHREVEKYISDVVARTEQTLSAPERQATEAAQASLQRCVQLKSELEDCAGSVRDIISIFSDSMSSTRTGLNVTAGTLNDVVEVFREVG